MDEVTEMLVDYPPFLVVTGQDRIVEVEDTHPAFGLVEEAVLFVYYGYFPFGTDSFCLF